MIPPRQRMIEDVRLGSLTANTQRQYTYVVAWLAKLYGHSLDRLTEDELRKHFLHLILERSGEPTEAVVREVSPSAFLDRHDYVDGTERSNISPRFVALQARGATRMQDFMFIYRGGDPNWLENTSPEDMQAVMGQWGEWMAKLEKAGQLVSGGSPLNYDGKRVTKDGVVTDISASEVKELVTGYSIVKAANYDEAVKLGKDCPIFLHEGTTLEVRAVTAM